MKRPSLPRMACQKFSKMIGFGHHENGILRMSRAGMNDATNMNATGVSTSSTARTSTAQPSASTAISTGVRRKRVPPPWTCWVRSATAQPSCVRDTRNCRNANTNITTSNTMLIALARPIW